MATVVTKAVPHVRRGMQSIRYRMRLAESTTCTSAIAVTSVHYQQNRSRGSFWAACGAIPVAALVGGGAAVACTEPEPASEKDEEDFFKIDKSFPAYKRADVAEHCTRESRVWVTYKGGVFDITDFIVNHPGGESKIMLAAGKDIGPFWRVYQQHMNNKLPRELLMGMQVGIVDPSEPKEEFDESDPYSRDPTRHPGLKFHNNKPTNAELPPSLIMDNWITPNSLFFIRHHHPVPDLNYADFTVSLGGLAVKPILLSLKDLRDRFPKSDATVTLQCGGNRRSEFNTVRQTSGISWGFGAISTARYEGVLLRDVLRYSGLLTPEVADSLGVHHVVFKAHDGLQASIPIEKALDPYGDVLLAYTMNGEDLPREHGGPLRVIVPGHVGVRNVKWVTDITVSKDEAEGPWQRGIAYKGFGPSVTSFEGIDVEKIQSIQEQPVTSAIVDPQPGYKVEPNESLTVKGFAWSGGGRGIVRVDVSIDGGKTWTSANLTDGSDQHPLRAWAWTFWELDVKCPDLPEGSTIELCCKATDSSYNVQPEYPDAIWNVRGLNNNSWFRTKLTVTVDE
eukprot:m.179828 g.179828  ORF g.179828 m.179828 type:complete len:564 (+) comp18398_c0_seq9:310-2001(+)